MYVRMCRQVPANCMGRAAAAAAAAAAVAADHTPIVDGASSWIIESKSIRVRSFSIQLHDYFLLFHPGTATILTAVERNPKKEEFAENNFG